MKFILKFLLFLLPLLAFDAFLAEPYWMRETFWQLPVKGLQRPIEILQMSDLQLRGDMGYREQWILQKLSKHKPDFVAVTGDVFENPEGMQAGIKFIQQMNNVVPVFVILGNWEHWAHVDVYGYGVKLLNSHVRFLRNNSMETNFHEQQLTIAGVDDPSTLRDDLSAALSKAKPGVPILLLAHAPAILNQAASHVNVILSGHTHGGQIDIPLYGPIWMPPGCWPYIYGAYHSGSTWLVVTSGVGTSMVPARFYCRPEISWVTLVPK